MNDKKEFKKKYNQKLQDLQYGRSKDILNWTSKINSSITTF